MACIINPQTGPTGEIIKWDPKQIPPMKPYIHIITSPSSPSDPLTTQDNMNFVKTKSLIYSAFHKNARDINFDIGYPTDAKWFEFLKDKWGIYTNFFVVGFLKAVYSIDENGSSTTYIQVDAKTIDYDIRSSRTANTSTSNDKSATSSPKTLTNAFAQRRAKLSSNSPRSTISKSDPVAIQEESDDDLNTITDHMEYSKLIRFIKYVKILNQRILRISSYNSTICRSNTCAYSPSKTTIVRPMQ